ncbi:MAG: Crp/Fnr family transcriptional regulator [Actinobacteria bacterium]|nr:Crp/Fnr family transcriptional regulator [Actinomycetota bacterium]
MNKTDNLDDFLGHLKKGLREKARSKFSPFKLERGQFVFFDGDPASTLYLVESGVAEANVVHGDGKVYIFHFLFPCDILGEGIIYGQEVYPFSAVIREEALLWKISRDDLLPLLDADPAFRDYLVEFVGRKLDHSYAKARCIAGERVERRVACILLKSIDETGIENCGERVIPQLTNRDISGLIGSTEETVSRVMSRLKKENVIGIKDKQLVILDREALMRYFDNL